MAPSPSPDKPGLSIAEVERLLARLGNLTSEIVLVGGQAVNFWVSHYEDQAAELRDEGPFTSKDVDFCGDRRAVEICAERLGGRLYLATMDDLSLNVGKVVFVDSEGYDREIDFIDQPRGLKAAEVYRLALPVKVKDANGNPTSVQFRVMQPIHCMESRVHNVAGLPQYRTEQGFKQLRASLICARLYLLELLGRGKVRDVLNLTERVFHLCLDDLEGRAIFADHHVDPFDAVVVDDRLPPEFRTRRYPQMRQLLTDYRTRTAPTSNK